MNIAEIFAALDTVPAETPLAFMNIKTREKTYALSGNAHSHRGTHSQYAFDKSSGDHKITAEEFRDELTWELENTKTFEWSGNLGQGPSYSLDLDTKIAITEDYRDSEGTILTWYATDEEMIFFTDAL